MQRTGAVAWRPSDHCNPLIREAALQRRGWQLQEGRVRLSRAAFGDVAIAGPNHATVQPLQVSLIPPVSPVYSAPPPVLKRVPGERKEKEQVRSLDLPSTVCKIPTSCFKNDNHTYATCGRLSNSPPSCSHSISHYAMYSLDGNRDLAGVIKLWILRWEIEELGLCRWAQSRNHKGP